MGYLNVKYSKVKELTVKIIGQILSKARNSEQLIRFLRLYEVVYQQITSHTNVENYSDGQNFFRLINQAVVKKEAVSLVLFFEDISEILPNDSLLISNHFEIVFAKFEQFICQKTTNISKKIAGLFEKIGKNKKGKNEECSEMQIEKSSEENADSFVKFALAFLEKTENNQKTYYQFKFFFSFVDSLARLPSSISSRKKTQLEIILAESIIRSQVFHSKALRSLISLTETLPQKLREFFARFNEKVDLREILMTVELKSLTQFETRQFLDLVTPILTHEYFNLKGQKNKQNVIAKQRFILNFVSSLPAAEINAVFECFLENLDANFISSKVDCGEIFAGLSFGMATKLLGLLEMAVNTLGLQITHLVPRMMDFLTQVFDVLSLAQKKLNSQNELEKRLLKIIKTHRRKIVDLFIKIYSKFIELDFDGFTRRILNSCFKRIEKSKSQNEKKMDNLTKLLLLFSEFEKFKAYFLEYPHILPGLMSYLSLPRVSKILAQKMNDLLLNLIQFYPGVNLNMQNETLRILDTKSEKLGWQISQNGKWSFLNAENGDEESLLGIHILRINGEVILEHLITYFENTSVLAKTSQAINQPFVRNLLITVLQKCPFENQDQIARILGILLAFLSPKQLFNLNTDKYSASSNYNSEFHEKIEPRVNQILQVLDIVSLILPHKKDVCEFFTNNILPLLSNVNNARILLGLRVVFCSIQRNPNSSAILPSVDFLAASLQPAKRLDHDLNYDLLFDELQSLSEKIGKLNCQNLKIALTFVFKLLGSQDLSVRIKSHEVFKLTFGFYGSEELRRVDIFLVLEEIFDKVPLVLRMMYSTEDCIKNYVQTYLLFADYYLTCGQELRDLQTRQTATLLDLKQLSEFGFFEGFLSPKIMAKTVSINEFTAGCNVQLPSVMRFILPMIENVLFFNLSKHVSDLKDNNFRVVSSKKAYLGKFVDAIAGLLKKLTSQFPFAKLTSFIHQKLNMLENQKEFQHPILVILSSIFENFSLFEAHSDAIFEINETFRTGNNDLQRIFEDQASFESNPHLRSFRNNFKQMKTGKMKKIRDNIHANIDFNVHTLQALNSKTETEIQVQTLKAKRSKLNNLVLLKLKKMMFTGNKNEENLELRFALSECFLKVLRLFPTNLFKIEYSKMIMELTQMLRQKDPSVREKTMKTLFKISKMTGPFLLSICFSEIGFALSVSSYRHVRNYTVWYILNQLYGRTGKGMGQLSHQYDAGLTFPNGSIDHLFRQLGEFISEETFSDMFEEKVSEDRKKKSKEMKKHKAKDILRLFVEQAVRPEAVV